VEDEGVAGGDLLEEVDVASDERGLGDEADAEALLAGEDFEDAAGDADATFYRLIWIRCRSNRDLVLICCEARGEGAELLFEEPGGVFFEVDFALEGEGPGLLRDVERAGRRGVDGGGLEEFVSVACVAVAAGELAAAEGVDGVGERELALGDGLVEDGAGGHGAEFDKVAVVCVGGFGGQAGEPGWA